MTERREGMAYLKGVLATVASLFLALLVPQLWWLIRGLSTEKATGFTVVAAGFLESILSPWFWILAVVFSVFFYFSSGFENKSLRVALFWIPSIGVTVGGFALWMLFALIARRFASGQG
jgi:hypothetical protein